MTIAVCVKCGNIKYGALVACEACGLTPSSEIDLAYSFVLTDHYLDVEKLHSISAHMMRGGPRPSLPPEQEEEFRAQARQHWKMAERYERGLRELLGESHPSAVISARKVLISHSWDRPEAYGRLLGILRHHNYAFEDLSVGSHAPLTATSEDDLKEQLAQRVGSVASLLLAATDDMTRKQFVMFEVDEAVKQRRRIVVAGQWAIGAGDPAGGPTLPPEIDAVADAVVGLDSDVLIPALEGANIRDLSSYLASDDSSLGRLVDWCARCDTGCVLLARAGEDELIANLNGRMRTHGISIKPSTRPRTLEQRAATGVSGVRGGRVLSGGHSSIDDDKTIRRLLASSSQRIESMRGSVKALTYSTMLYQSLLMVFYEPYRES